MSSCCPSPTPPKDGCPTKKRVDIIFWGSLFSVVPLYVLFLIDSPLLTQYTWLGTMAHTTHQMIHAMWWGVALGALFIGLLSKIPRDFIMAILGKDGTWGSLVRATGAGVLLDLCNHGILMVASKLYERGASAGQVMAFLLASPWNSISLTLVLAGLIGWGWTFAFIVLSAVIALITGRIFDVLVADGALPKNPNTAPLRDDFDFWKDAKAGISATSFDTTFMREVIVHGVVESKMVVRWLLFGVLLAAVLRATMDPSQFEAYFGATLLGLGATILGATVLEVCSEGATPIAADLLTRAKAPGNAFAFLMAGVATDYTEIMVIKDTTKSWKIGLFLPLITVPQVVLIAWLIHLFG